MAESCLHHRKSQHFKLNQGLFKYLYGFPLSYHGNNQRQEMMRVQNEENFTFLNESEWAPVTGKECLEDNRMKAGRKKEKKIKENKIKNPTKQQKQKNKL